MSLPRRVRFEILRRDNHACRYCGAKAPRVELEVDHVIPRHHGGTDDRWNLTAACVDCNRSKGAGIPHDDVIRDVRHDEVNYQSSKGLPVYPCVHCSKPLQWGDDEEQPTDCGDCNMILFMAYEAGLKQGRAL